MNAVVVAIVAVLLVGGSGLILVSAVSMLRERDAYARINVLSPATGLGMPMIVIAAYLHHVLSHGVDLGGIIRLLVTVASLLIVSSVASNVLARAAYLSGAPVRPDTQPQDLAEEPD